VLAWAGGEVNVKGDVNVKKNELHNWMRAFDGKIVADPPLPIGTVHDFDENLLKR